MLNTIPKVLILGGGFGGLQAAKSFVNAQVEVVLVDANNYHLFQPLLYQVASAGLEPEHVAYPLRKILRRQRNVQVHMAQVEHILLDQKRVRTDRGLLDYDFLIVALGAQNRMWGIPGLEQHALPLKSLSDAIAIRNHVLAAFEQACLEKDAGQQVAWLTFVVVGGGPTGVEMAGALAELIEQVMRKDFAALDYIGVELHLVEGMETLLAGFPPELQTSALKTLEGKGIQVHLGASVAAYDGSEIALSDGTALSSKSLIWAAGVEGRDVLASMGVARSSDQRILIGSSLEVPGHPEAYVIGDAAYMEVEGSALPMMAPVAVQMAEHAVENIKRQISGDAVQPFRYRNPGRLATIGRNAAVAQVGRLRLQGFTAWLVWLAVHLMQLVGFRNRLMVFLNWAWEYLFYDRAVRLIIRADDPTRGKKTGSKDLGPEVTRSLPINNKA
jgi:NADH dehydrogenase